MHSRKKSGIALTIAVAAGLWGCLAPAARADTGQFDGGVALSSDYVLYGLTRTQGNPAVQAQLGWANDSGWSAGAWFSTVDYNDGPSISRELDFYLGKRWSLGRDFAFLTELTQYTFNEPPSQPSQDYSEVRVALSFRELLEFSASVSPDYYAFTYWSSAKQTAYTYGVTAQLPITHRWSLNAGAGRFDLSRLLGETYTYWSAGGELRLGRLNLALSYIGSDDTAAELFGSRAQDGFVATLALRIP